MVQKKMKILNTFFINNEVLIYSSQLQSLQSPEYSLFISFKTSLISSEIVKKLQMHLEEIN